MIITRFIKKDELISSKIISEFQKIISVGHKIIENDIKTVTDVIRNDVVCFVEYPYVERIYRDSYYSFFSKKHKHCYRDSIRISFFLNSLTEEEFYSYSDEELNDKFLGYISLRPTTFRVIGNSFLSPKAMANHDDFVCCLCKKVILVNGRIVTVTGFPYCGQDSESITCAEVSILNIMSYFSHKYPEYSTILPSQIAKILSKQVPERQLPSHGLRYLEIAFVLKKLGFGTRIYSAEGKDLFDKGEFKELLFIYIESGLPIILMSENHAVLAIGRKNMSKVSLTNGNCLNMLTKKHHSFTDFFDQLLIMDDNKSPYKMVDYNNLFGKKGSFMYFIVPFYPKIHLEAHQIKSLFWQIQEALREKENILFVKPNEDYIFKYFFTSSKSYKNYIAKSVGLSVEFKKIISRKSMPKFIWIGEIIRDKNLKNDPIVEGIIALDATESGLHGNLLFAKNFEYLIIKPSQSGKYVRIPFDNENLKTYKNNLKGTHTQWQTA